MDIKFQSNTCTYGSGSRVYVANQKQLGKLTVEKYFTPTVALKLLAVIAFVALIVSWNADKTDKQYLHSKEIIAAPKIDDIYILDHRLYQEHTRPNENYRIAKVVDITGDTVTLLFGNMLYPTLRASEQAIRYGQLRYHDYFETRRYNWTETEIEMRLDDGVISQAHRPRLGQLFGNSVNAKTHQSNSKIFIPGKRENQQGESWLLQTHVENHLTHALQAFSKSAALDYVPAKVNLAQLYLTAEYLDKQKALYWLKEAAQTSNKEAILKYEIVCQQVVGCYWNDFVDELVAAGVDIKLRNYKPLIK